MVTSVRQTAARAAVRAEPPADAGPGLVTCARTPDDLGGVWEPAFPRPDLLGAAAGLIEARAAWDGHEGPRPRLVIAPGAIALERHDLARLERSAERARHRREVAVKVRAAALLAGEDLADVDVASRRSVLGWSRRSRARMTRRLCELDYSPLLVPGRLPALVTLTYPGCWICAVPSGAVLKRHLESLKSRFRHSWGTRMVGVWKLEFQRRGAPHVHILMTPPHGVARAHGGVGAGMQFPRWLSAVWADIVSHPDPEQRRQHERAGTAVDYPEALRFRDPKRVAVYFTKHGTFRDKAYQHIVPRQWTRPGKGPGRWWGYWGLQRVVAEVEVGDDQAVMVARILRRWAAAQGTTREVRVVRGRRSRTVRRPVRRLSHGAGWVSVHDGAAFASQLALALSVACSRAASTARISATRSTSDREGLSTIAEISPTTNA